MRRMLRIQRRARCTALAACGTLWLAALASAAEPQYAPVVPGVAVELPRDHGSHRDFRTEWWYLTGWLTTAGGEPLGFQVTFFRTRPKIDTANPSAFAAHELVVAHAAVSDRKRGRLWHDQRIARAALGLAGAATGRVDVWLDRWRLQQRDGGYATQVEGEGFAFALQLDTTQAPLINGDKGFSRKGPALLSSSYYYSEPHLRVRGSVTREGRNEAVTGQAWLDHEWSSEYLDPQATGWDWIGINLDDGGALMAFRIRGADGAARWGGGTLRDRAGHVRTFQPHELQFEPRRLWKSPRTGTSYPVDWLVTAGDLRIALRPLLDDQENDARLSTGAVYWEGAVEAMQGATRVGRGYLELTGYGEPLKLP